MSKSRTIAVAFAVALAFTAAYSHAAQGAHVNYLTFSATMALPGATLPPGTYTFEIANPSSNLRAVSVSSREGGQRHFLRLTRTVQRPATLGRDTAVTLGEAVAGAPVPILAWYPIGRSTGYEFVY